jgi:predicted RNase H-like nuclease
MPQVAGVDGCSGGWLALQRHSETGDVTASVAFSAADLLGRAAKCGVVAIDIPIGTPDRGARSCDLEARRLLGSPRASSVFPCPVRPTVDARTYDEAACRSIAADGRSISRQAFAILDRIRDVDHEVRTQPEWKGRLREIHPELSFYFWNEQRPMSYAKRTANGSAERRALVDAHFGPAFALVRSKLPRGVAADDDILDAFAAVWSAERILAGRAVRIPAGIEVDAQGIPMEMLA